MSGRELPLAIWFSPMFPVGGVERMGGVEVMAGAAGGGQTVIIRRP